MAIDPLTQILPVLHLGPRMQHLVIHSLRQLLAASPSSPAMDYTCTSQRLPAHFGKWREEGRRGRKVWWWQMAVNLLGLRSHEVMMVAAHQEDLRAAQAQGMQAAYVPHPLERGLSHMPDLIPDLASEAVETISWT